MSAAFFRMWLLRADLRFPLHPQASSPSLADLAAEVARLRRENGQLRMEREPKVGA